MDGNIANVNRISVITEHERFLTLGNKQGVVEGEVGPGGWGVGY